MEGNKRTYDGAGERRRGDDTLDEHRHPIQGPFSRRLHEEPPLLPPWRGVVINQVTRMEEEKGKEGQA